jgi:hypothetical protein
MVTAFIALAALASVNYSGSEEQKGKLAENVWYQKAQNSLETVLAASKILADFNLNKNLGYGQKVKDELETVDWKNISLGGSSEEAAESSPENKSGFWSGLSDRLKKEWQESNADEVDTNFNDFFTYQKTATGADMIFTFKNGSEYKFPLPFKFLSEQ